MNGLMTTMTLSDIARIETASKSAEPRALLDAVTACDDYCYDVRASLWACGMTLAFGPTGLHPSRARADGYPLPETLEMPEVKRVMDAARERVTTLIAMARYEARA